jgi:hypothetical protein
MEITVNGHALSERNGYGLVASSPPKLAEKQR